MELLFADRSERGKLRFTGPQRAWFLHQIMTQAFEDMAPGEARDSAFITAHGRMVAYLETVATDEEILVHFEPELRPTLPDAIRRYVFATQVEIEDVTDDRALVLVVGRRWREPVDALDVPYVPHSTRAVGEDAGYLWVARSAVPGVVEALAAAGARQVIEGELEAIRVRNGAPRWGREMNEKSFPQEAGVDAWAVHYEKGCYVGQEAMAKIHFRGKPNRRLARLEGVELAVGADVLRDGTRVGTVTSAIDDVALAIVKHDLEPGVVVEVGKSDAKVVA